MKTAYPNLRQPVQITIYANIPFDNSYQHHTLISRLFKDDGDSIYNAVDETYGKPCERFINRRNVAGTDYYYPRYTMTGEYNFNYSNGLVSSVTLELTPAQTNCNYMKVVCGEDVYYYFITSITQQNYDTYTLNLELDVLMTYQDEFLSGIAHKPVFTIRKMCHRYTSDGLYPHCADFKTGDSAFAGVKPSIIKERIDLDFTSNLNVIKDIMWLYMCVDDDFIWEGQSQPTDNDYTAWQFYRYKYDGITHPLTMICMPLNVNSFTLKTSDSTLSVTISRFMLERLISQLVASGKIHGSKISPYPPFTLNENDTITKSDDDYTLTSDNITRIDTPYNNSRKYINPKTTLVTRGSASDIAYLAIIEEYKTPFTLSSISLFPANSSAPNISMNRLPDPKLLFSPFKKYLLMATYSQGNEFYPELIYSDGVRSTNNFEFETIYNCYIGDYSIFTYQNSLTDDNDVTFYKEYKINNIGISASINYLIPVGTDALEVFKATQAQSFYQSKIASGITAGLSIAGGVASIGLGVAGAVGSMGMTAPMSAGLIATGAGAVASGVASGVNTIKSTNAKIEDLKNTPDAINVQGSSFIGDYSRTRVLPFIIIYDISESVKEQANDFFYNYGYEVARDCYFNLEVSNFDNDVSGKVDNNLFGRTIFNYIQINEDITNKIDYDMPLIVKKKLSSIFNQGITIWNFFGFLELWRTRTTPSLNYNIDMYFMQHTKDNTEYYGEYPY